MATASAFSGAAADGRVLLVSVWASAGFAVVSLVWGLLAGSQMIVFDGLYSFASVLLSLLAVVAVRTAARGPDERYPWGREVWEPVTIVVKAAALGALSVYALIGAVVEILDGGRSVSAGWAVLYAVLATAGGSAASWYLRRRSRRGSDLIRAEAAEWVGDTLLSFGVLIGFVVALVLERTGRSDMARYVDPAMVALISAAFLPVPLRLGTQSLREVLTMAPAPDLRRRLAEHVAEVEREYGFAESYLRTSKVGSRLDVEIDFVVPETARAQCVRDFDEVRADLHDRLRRLAPVTAMTVSFTADARWAR
jgi:cation diffusion facilitator family transporter